MENQTKTSANTPQLPAYLEVKGRLYRIVEIKDGQFIGANGMSICSVDSEYVVTTPAEYEANRPKKNKGSYKKSNKNSDKEYSIEGLSCY